MTTANLLYEEDLTLLEQLKAEDPGAFAFFYGKYRKYLMIAATSMLGNEVEAQDLVQEFFIDFWERQLYMRIDPAQSKNREMVIRNYVHKVVYNRCIDKLAQRKTQEQRIAQIPVPDEAVPPQIRMEADERHRELLWSLNTAIARIPPLSAQVFELSYIQHKSRMEIALQMGVSPHTVKNQLLRAMKILRSHLKKG
ncbi:MAG TPA: sigma-70 family RNA polymerase sigma factor [Chitinophaga sp.]|uniref:RNA polymerase sigma factor n=1 Tax=Chitinophaga sp. TaxID=1869181 RepID=UPI002DBE9848|nr:sigma-70 family RNA polymerase sigma factor [Chitinophaga sp.]HEU4555551.1 sigma-70 family RNA polymerase sigma factor [Chitinophaga sp.]